MPFIISFIVLFFLFIFLERFPLLFPSIYSFISLHLFNKSFSFLFLSCPTKFFFGINPSSFIFNLAFIMNPFNSMRTDGRVNQLQDVKHILGWLSKSLSRQISSSMLLSTFIQRKKTFLSHWSPFATLALCL